MKKLLNVKSLVTLALTLVVCILALCGKIDVQQIYLMIIAFFFEKKKKKKTGGITIG